MILQCVYLCRILPTESAHFLVEWDSSAWEFPVAMPITQLNDDSRSDTGTDPSSKSWLLPPPQLTAKLRRFCWREVSESDLLLRLLFQNSSGTGSRGDGNDSSLMTVGIVVVVVVMMMVVVM